MSGLLVLFHCESNTGYAIGRLERVFFEMGVNVFGSADNVHFAYPSVKKGMDPVLQGKVSNIVEFDYRDNSASSADKITRYIKDNCIRTLFGFDQPVGVPTHKVLRRAGINRFISYWGAPMSSVNRGFRLFAKRMQVALTPYKPDLFILESEAMRETAVCGRGIPLAATRVVYNGVDEKKFSPVMDKSRAYDMFEIPPDRKIVYYSGHMEDRKGVHIIVKAAVDLIVNKGRKDVHFLLLGNKDGEERKFDPLYRGTAAEGHITFGGYRSGVEYIMPCCYMGVIASTGWDSFPLSPLEMQACGLPVVASSLQGLKESIADGVSGFSFKPGDHMELADKIQRLLSSTDLRESMSNAARQRIVSRFTVEQQIKNLSEILREAEAVPSGKSQWSKAVASFLRPS